MAETVLRPASVSELAEAVTSLPRLRVVGSGSRLGWCTPWSGPVVCTSGLAGVVSLRPADGVVVVRAGTPVTDLLDELEGQGLTLPLARGLPFDVSQRGGTVGGLVATGLPHALEAQRGPVRDWVLGVTVVRGDGSVAKSGSTVLKSVAGFDVHRFAVGSRGSVFALAEVVLRLVRVASVPDHLVEEVSGEEVRFAGRVPATSVPGLAGCAWREPSGLFWSAEKPEVASPGWWIGPGGSRSAVQSRPLEVMAKETLDPDGRFAPGWAE